jgi:hypothetical protein
MKTNIFLYHISFIYSQNEKCFTKKVVEKTETHNLCSVTFLKIASFMRKCGKILEERGRPQMTIWRMRIACWIPKATDTHTDCVILLFHCNNGCTNSPQYYVIRILPVLFNL